MVVQSAVADLGQMIRQQAASRPDAVAIVFEGRQTTFSQLDQRASRVANGLLAANAAPQTRIGLLDKNSDAFYEILYGAAKARAVPVAVNWRLAVPEMAFILNDAGATTLFVGEEYFAVAEELLPRLTTVTQTIALSGSHPTWESYQAWRDRQPPDDPRLPTPSDDVVIQLYTSGTTGHPKGVQITHDNVLAALAVGGQDWCPSSSDDVILACMPQFHIAGSLWGMFSVQIGARCVIVRQPDMHEILRLIPAEQVTLAFFVPAVILILLQTPGCRETDFSNLKSIVYGASPMPLDLVREAMATIPCDFVQVYGLTETTGVVTALQAADHDPAGTPRMRSCGKPIQGAEIKVVDDDGLDCQIGAVGEILVRSGQVMTGYWNRDEANQTALRDGWFSTGDAGYFDADGYLYIYDRVKDMIISGGENVYPAEVESAMFGHPAVADVGVIGVPDERWGETVKAIVVLAPGQSATEEELIAYTREQIAHFKAPKSIDFVESLPRNPSGKILKRVLREPYWEGRERRVN